MTAIAILEFIKLWGPAALQALPVLQKLTADIKAGLGDKEADAAYWATIIQLSTQRGEDIYSREGIAPPPPKPPTTP